MVLETWHSVVLQQRRLDTLKPWIDFKEKIKVLLEGLPAVGMQSGFEKERRLPDTQKIIDWDKQKGLMAFRYEWPGRREVQLIGSMEECGKTVP